MFNRKVRWYTHKILQAVGDKQKELEECCRREQGKALMDCFIEHSYVNIQPVLIDIAKEQQNAYRRKFQKINIYEEGTGCIIDTKYVIRNGIKSPLVYKTQKWEKDGDKVTNLIMFEGFDLSSDVFIGKYLLAKNHLIYRVNAFKKIAKGTSLNRVYICSLYNDENGQKFVLHPSDVVGIFRKFLYYDHIFDDISNLVNIEIEDLACNALCVTLRKFIPRENTSLLELVTGFVMWYTQAFRDIGLSRETVSLWTSSDDEASITEESIYQQNDRLYHQDKGSDIYESSSNDNHMPIDAVKKDSVLKDMKDAEIRATVLKNVKPHLRPKLAQKVAYSSIL